MAKYVVLSFDDGRLDTYENAILIMAKCGLRCTINIASDFIENPQRYHEFASSGGKPMRIEEIIETQKQGMEIASHGHTHTNKVLDIEANIEKLKRWGVNTMNIGFASPHSYITCQNIAEIEPLLESGAISYVRSGTQVRREGFLYAGLHVIQELTHSKYLFYSLNKKLLFPIDRKDKLVFGVAITRNTSVKQIQYLLSRLPEEYCCILMSHSILYPEDIGHGYDKWYWDAERFNELCNYLSSTDEFRVLRTIDLFKENHYNAD